MYHVPVVNTQTGKMYEMGHSMFMCRVHVTRRFCVSNISSFISFESESD